MILLSFVYILFGTIFATWTSLGNKLVKDIMLSTDLQLAVSISFKCRAVRIS